MKDNLEINVFISKYKFDDFNCLLDRLDALKAAIEHVEGFDVDDMIHNMLTAKVNQIEIQIADLVIPLITVKQVMDAINS